MRSELTPDAGEADARVSPANLARISARHFGVPYGHDPRVRPRRLDCQTYVEHVMAEALSPAPELFSHTLNRIRYRGGVVKMEERLVYPIPDWLESPWPARDATDELAAGAVGQMSKVIDRARHFRRPQLAHRGGYFIRQRVDTSYIPRATAGDRHNPDGSIAIFVQQRAGIVAAHCGFLFVRNGATVLRHASQTRWAVIQEPLRAYLQRAPEHVVGLKVLLPDTSRWD